jgi:DNA-binding phage protein
MALTRAFKDTVMARVQRDERYAHALLQVAVRECLDGDLAAGKALLRDLVNATLGFEELGQRLAIPAKSLHRMLSARGNPSSESFLRILGVVLHETGSRLEVSPRRSRSNRQRSRSRA